MKRRNFLKKTAAAGLAAGAAFSVGTHRLDILAADGDDSPYDLVAVMGGSPEAMFDIGIQSIGGMGSFVSSGQKVVVKPNIGWDVIPERGANTNPGLVARIIEHCFRAGASEVSVFDNTCDEWTRCYRNSGIESAARGAGARIVPANTESYYRDVSLPEARSLKTTQIHNLMFEADVIINVPVLKHHSGTRMTAALKNMMGVVWDRRFWHRNNLNQCIADYTLWEKKPCLHVIDAYRVMLRNGPRGISVDDIVDMRAQIISPDWVAADAAAALMMDMNPMQIGYIPLAHELGAGNMQLEELNINRIQM